MPTSKTVEAWGFSCLGYETSKDGEVKLVWCKTCRDYSNRHSVQFQKKGVAKIASEKFVAGSTVVKKNNFRDHTILSKTHAAAVLFLSDKSVGTGKSTSTISSSTIASGAPRQTTLTPYVQRLNSAQRMQLTRKMQIAHYTAINAKSFSFYGNLTKFCKDTLKVDVGKGYIYDTAGAEMISYLSKSSRIKTITEPLNSGENRYYSIMNDGSSSAKTMDEKELFLMKTAGTGKPTFSLMSLAEPDETTVIG